MDLQYVIEQTVGYVTCTRLHFDYICTKNIHTYRICDSNAMSVYIMLYWMPSLCGCYSYGHWSVKFYHKTSLNKQFLFTFHKHTFGFFVVVVVVVGITSIGGMFCGFLGNHIDIAPNYAGTLMAITNTAATLPGIIMPIFVGTITHGNVMS